MKNKILRCERCGDETLHRTTKSMGSKRGGFHVRREVKHCNECNLRTINNKKLNKTYTRG